MLDVRGVGRAGSGLVLDFADDGVEQAALEVQGGGGWQGTEEGEDLRLGALIAADGADKDADGAVGPDSETGGGEACRSVIGEQNLQSLPWSPQFKSSMTKDSVTRVEWDSRKRRKASASSSLKSEAQPSST